MNLLDMGTDTKQPDLLGEIPSSTTQSGVGGSLLDIGST